jgi:hypothetical protein
MFSFTKKKKRLGRPARTEDEKMDLLREYKAKIRLLEDQIRSEIVENLTFAKGEGYDFYRGQLVLISQIRKDALAAMLECVSRAKGKANV